MLGFFSNNQTIKVNAAVQRSTTVSAVTYTAPSNGYAILNLYLETTSGVATMDSVTWTGTGSTGTGSHQTVYVGPGRTITLTNFGFISAISGVEFINSP